MNPALWPHSVSIMKSIDTRETTLQVLDEGAGQPLLFVHGFPLDHSMWHEQIRELAGPYRVIVPDLRGFGRSPVRSGTATMTAFAQDLHDILQALEIDDPVTLCGLSMGGYIAWQFEQIDARRLKSLILCDTRAAADSPETVEARHNMIDTVLREGPAAIVEGMLSKLFSAHTRESAPERVQQTRDVILNTDPEGIAAALRGMASRPDATARLPRISVPALLLVGEDDQLTPPAEMQEVANQLPHARLVTIPHAGHMAPLEQPAAVNALIRDFLEAP